MINVFIAFEKCDWFGVNFQGKILRLINSKIHKKYNSQFLKKNNR